MDALAKIKKKLLECYLIAPVTLFAKGMVLKNWLTPLNKLSMNLKNF